MSAASLSAATTALPWVYFWAAPEPTCSQKEVRHSSGIKTFYQILEVKPVCGEVLKVQAGWSVLRVETPVSSLLSAPETSGLILKGNVRHLQYTSSSVRAELQKKSALPYPSSGSTLAVLIPIRKSEAWWNLSQDERQKHFDQKSHGRNHTAIGYDFADRIYRKLYHSRYLEGSVPLPYDFLTYFEFDQKDRPLFEKLLLELRDLEKNPEWSYVDFEMEIWMSKKETPESVLSQCGESK